MDIKEIISLLITDRTQEDVSLENDKGTYNADDLNRVEGITEYISNRLQNLEQEIRNYATQQNVAWDDRFGLGFEPEEAIITAKTDWIISDLQTKRQMRKYLENVVRECTLLGVDYSSIPETMVHLSYEGANTIESLLVQCLEAIEITLLEKKQIIDESKETE